MAFIFLAIRFALRNRLRTAITALAVGVSLLAFLLLRVLVASWHSAHALAASSDRLMLRHKVSISFSVFTRQAEEIRAIPGVQEVSWQCWYVGYYRDERNQFTQLAVDPETYMRLYPEFRPPAEQLSAWFADRAGAVVGDQLAQTYGWKLGDTISLKGTIYADKTLTIRGIYTGMDQIDRHRLFMHYNYLDVKDGAVHRLLVKVDGPGVGRRIDAAFADSETPTTSESELSIERQWASWSAGVVSAIDASSLLVLAILMIVLANTMAMATRESTREYGAMRAIGYRRRHIVAMVLAEGCVVGTLGIAAGLSIVQKALEFFSTVMENQMGGSWKLELAPRVTIVAVVVALVASMLASAWPAWRSGHAPIVDALRKVA
jgi:putative ABC transport system permease protein